MQLKERVALVGCGWLGMPVAQVLLDKGYPVAGSTTREARLALLEAAGIEPYVLDLSQQKSLDNLRFLHDANYVVVTVPFRRAFCPPDQYVELLTPLVRALKEACPQKLIFTSSTSIYGSGEGLCEEDSPIDVDNERAGVLYRVEQMFLALEETDVVILRLAGLYGPDRLPGRFLAGQSALTEGSRYVNMVHLADCVAVIVAMLEQPSVRGVFNVVSDVHPLRREYFQTQALRQGFPVPQFCDQDQPPFGKRVSNDKLKRVLGYSFQYPDPMMPWE